MARGWLAVCLPLFLLSLFSFCSLSITAPVEAFEQRADDDKMALRILPLGASITWGLKSPSSNGYRKHLRDQLCYSGVVPGSDGAGVVDNVGSKVSRFRPGDKVVTLFNQIDHIRNRLLLLYFSVLISP